MFELEIVSLFTKIDFNLYTHYFFVLATNLFLLILILYFLYITIRHKSYKYFFTYVVFAVLGYVVKKLISLIAFRTRPYVLLHMQGGLHFTGTSFYSMHTFLAFLTAFFILHITKNKHISLIIFIFASIVALTRIVLAMHYLSDVVFSILVTYLIYRWYVCRKK